jgi:hypothetical protein
MVAIYAGARKGLSVASNVRFGSKADIALRNQHDRFTPQKRTFSVVNAVSAEWQSLCANSGHQRRVCSNESKKIASQRSLRKFHHAY